MQGPFFLTEVGVLGKFLDIFGLLFTLCGILEFGDRVCETAAAGGLSVCQPESGVTCILLPPTMMQGGDILNIEKLLILSPAFSFLPQ